MWFPDTPNLSSLVLELKKNDGSVMESVVQRIGFEKYTRSILARSENKFKLLEPS